MCIRLYQKKKKKSGLYFRTLRLPSDMNKYGFLITIFFYQINYTNFMKNYIYL
jgi:hypothetical protein